MHTSLDVCTVGVHICPANLSQDDIISEVANFHLLEVIDLFLAVLASNLLHLVAEALEDCATARLLNAVTVASISTLLCDRLMAGSAQTIVQPARQGTWSAPYLLSLLDSRMR